MIANYECHILDETFNFQAFLDSINTFDDDIIMIEVEEPRKIFMNIHVHNYTFTPVVINRKNDRFLKLQRNNIYHTAGMINSFIVTNHTGIDRELETKFIWIKKQLKYKNAHSDICSRCIHQFNYNLTGKCSKNFEELIKPD